jgi:hypothetical protein
VVSEIWKPKDEYVLTGLGVTYSKCPLSDDCARLRDVIGALSEERRDSSVLLVVVRGTRGLPSPNVVQTMVSK